MIVTQYPFIDENGNERADLIKHYSDQGFVMRQIETGIEYGEAVDVYPCRYTYEETDKQIEPADELTDAINALGILGVE